jgi:hypothetical protein
MERQMRVIVLTILVSFTLSSVASAFTTVNVIESKHEAGAYEAITVSSTAIGFTASNMDSPRCRAVFITVESDQIRFRIDGTDPTSSEGHLVNAGSNITLVNEHDIHKFKAIRVTTDATLRVTYRY